MSATVDADLELSEDDLVAICSDVWACFLGEEPDPYAPPLDTAGEAAATTVLATIGITGAWAGQVLLTMPTEGALLATRRMTGTDEPSAVDVADAIGELCNMVGGNIKSLAPSPSHLGLPIVVSGAAAPALGSEAVQVRRADLGWAGTTVHVSVWARPTHRTEPLD
jgi:chemotaxis protein CheX